VQDPDTHWKPSPQAVHEFPRAPQALAELPDWQMPAVSQQPMEQVDEEHRGAGGAHAARRPPASTATIGVNERRRMKVRILVSSTKE